VTLVYSSDRERRLSLLLRAIFVLGVLLAALAAYAVGVAGDAQREPGLVFAALAVVLLVTSVVALRALPARDANAKRAAILAGVAVVLTALAFLPSYLGIVILVLAGVQLMLALLRDDPDTLG
jgi:asparagine N-glycosylation enzyme membrane subunit Stt3